MKRTLYCETCAREKNPVLADRYVDDQYLCMMCFKAEGYELTDGEKVIQTVSMTLTCPVDIRPLRNSAPRRAQAARPAVRRTRVVGQHGECVRRQPRAISTGSISRECQYCHSEFIAKQPHARYCTPNCNWRAARERKRPTRKVEVCSCGKTIPADRRIDSITCSSTCTHREYLKAHPLKPRPARNCVWCGTEFTPGPRSRTDAKFCRRNCKRMWHTRELRNNAKVVDGLLVIYHAPTDDIVLGLERS